MSTRSWRGAGRAANRDLYARAKLALARKECKYGQNYADTKTEVVEQIMTRARGAVGGG